MSMQSIQPGAYMRHIFFAILIFLAMGNTFLFGQDAKMIKSNGDVFRTLSDNENLMSSQIIVTFDISKTDPDVMFAGFGTGGIYKTTDRGKNWTEVAPFFIMSLAIDESNPFVVYALEGG